MKTFVPYKLDRNERIITRIEQSRKTEGKNQDNDFLSGGNFISTSKIYNSRMKHRFPIVSDPRNNTVENSKKTSKLHLRKVFNMNNYYKKKIAHSYYEVLKSAFTPNNLKKMYRVTFHS